MTDVFTIHDFYWRDFDKKDSANALVILNLMAEKQKWAVRVYASSRYEDGYNAGIDSVESE